MKKEYDFSNAERGKFHRRGAKLNLPVYLDPTVHNWVSKMARKKGEEVSTLVNRLLIKERELIETVQ
jgi:hypothetical protein